jgi:hypothetical protein
VDDEKVSRRGRADLVQKETCGSEVQEWRTLHLAVVGDFVHCSTISAAIWVASIGEDGEARPCILKLVLASKEKNELHLVACSGWTKEQRKEMSGGGSERPA